MGPISWTAPRTWVAGEVVTASLLNTHLRDNIKVGRGYNRVIRTAGSFTLNSTAWANTSTALDQTLAATTGDVVTGSLNGVWNSEAVNGALNLTCAASGAGFSTKTANTDNALVGWFGPASIFMQLSGSASRTIASADISGGNTIIRLRHRTQTAANKTLFATTAYSLIKEVRNCGPHVAP